MDNTLPEDWSILRQWLPEDLASLAKKHGFMRRARGVQDVEVWLRMILMHVAGGLSLEQTVLRSREFGLAEVSAVALFKRLRKAGPWLEGLTRHMMEARDKRSATQQKWMRRVVVVDATDVQEPGSSGTDWRVHYAVRLSDLGCEHYEITDTHGGEQLGRFKFKPAQIVVGDRGYCHRAGAAQVLNAKADLVIRLQQQVFPLEDKAGKRLDLAAWGRRLTGHKVKERAVWFVHQGKRYPLRLCAVRRSQTAIQSAHKRQRRRASRQGHTLQPLTLELAHYIFVITSLPQAEWTTHQVLCLYRYRWQIELVFKRLKSLLGVGHVPKTTDASAYAWMQAKILTALIIERAMQEARFFSPWGFPLAP